MLVLESAKPPVTASKWLVALLLGDDDDNNKSKDYPRKGGKSQESKLSKILDAWAFVRKYERILLNFFSVNWITIVQKTKQWSEKKAPREKERERERERKKGKAGGGKAAGDNA